MIYLLNKFRTGISEEFAAAAAPGLDRGIVLNLSLKLRSRVLEIDSFVEVIDVGLRLDLKVGKVKIIKALTYND